MIYSLIRKRAHQIVALYPPPRFYCEHASACEASQQLFDVHPVLVELRRFAATRLDDDLGHGFNHAVKVTLDAGALMLIEGGQAGYPQGLLARRVLLVQCAAMLHDLKRKEPEHAIKGAEHARTILRRFPLLAAEIEDIQIAIRNHEAFKPTLPINTAEGALLSNCLYDADKFRWGPDNFIDTVWQMVTYHQTPLTQFIALYPRGLEKMARIKQTFRTATGQQFGPQIIDIGIAIGEQLLKVIQSEFKAYL